MTDCIFCKIINQEIPSAKVYEDEAVYAFLDISQTTKGHTLLVPKTHVKDIFDYSAECAGIVLSRIPLIAKAIEKAFPEMEGLNIVNNNREMAYQSVFHSHWHFIPRYSQNDGFSIKFTNRMGEINSEELSAIAQCIAKEVESGVE